MSDLIVSTELQTFLVAQGIGQMPDAPPSLVLPAIFDNPKNYAPEPRRGPRDGPLLENATITLADVITTPADGLEAWLEEAFVEVVVRADDDHVAKLLHRRIRDLIVPITSHGGNHYWQMAGLLVERSFQSKPEQPLRSLENRFTDRVATYGFSCRRKVLAGLPPGTP